jgi:NAD(P)-dependent dehydrogenase (short-subunit alcohol dehydrogenase family)
MSEMTDEFADRCAIVTGGASGIGAACCELLADAGAAVVIADRDKELGARLSERLSAGGRRAMHVTVDVTRAQECQAVVADAVRWAGSLDIAINAAGIAGPNTPIVAMSDDDWRAVLSVNLDGVFFSMRAQLEQMALQGHGSVVNIASILGLVAPAAEQGAGYTASKHAVIGLTRAAALEHAGSGVRVNCVAPGYVQTPLLDGVQESLLEAFRALHPAGRLGQAREVAEAILFLASDRASFITGAVLTIDGGYTTQ